MNAPSVRLGAGFAALCTLLLGGCDDPLTERQLIDSTRVLGARVEVTGDSERAWPRPAETASVSWLVADPEPAPELGWAFAVCAAEATSHGMPRCQSAAFAEFASHGLHRDPPAIEFVVPEESLLARAERLLVYGAICKNEEPILADPFENTRCGDRGGVTLLEIQVERSESNHNPTLRDEPLTFDGAAWPAPSNAWLEGETCSAVDATSELPLTHPDGTKHRISARLSTNDREPVTSLDGAESEELWISSFATGGHLDRPLSVIESHESALSLDLTWQAPRQTETGSVVRFYFVARDLRGGADWVVRTACVVP